MIKQQNIDSNTLSYLKFQTPEMNKKNIIVFFIILLYFTGIIPIIGEPFSFSFFIAAIIPIALISIWAIVYVIDPYKNEKSYYLFFGIYGIVNTYVFFLVVVKLLYVNIGVEGTKPFVLWLMLFIALLVGVNILNVKALNSGTYDKLQKKKSLNMSWAMIGALGYIVGQFILSFIYSDDAVSTLLIVLVSLLALLTSYFSVYIHRYYFIHKNIELVKQVYPNFSLPKSERNTRKKKLK